MQRSVAYFPCTALCPLLILERYVHILLLAACFSCRKPAPSANVLYPPAPQGKVDAGRYDLTVSGDWTGQIQGTGLDCEVWPNVTEFHAKGASTSAFSMSASQSRVIPIGESPAFPVPPFYLEIEGIPFQSDYQATGIEFQRQALILNEAQFQTKDGFKKVTASGVLTCPGGAGLEVPPEIASLVLEISGQPYRPYSTYQFGRLQDARAISALAQTPDSAFAWAEKLRMQLPSGWTAWVGTMRFVDIEEPKGQEFAEVVIANVSTTADMVRLAHLDPVNYGFSTEQMAGAFQRLEDLYGVQLVQADVESTHGRVPLTADTQQLAADLLEICPTGFEGSETTTPEALSTAIQKSGTFYCWWD